MLHLNAFGGDGVLPAYAGRQAVKDGSVHAQRQMVDWLHRHGATVCINHPLQGASSPTGLARRLVTTRGQHADLIEIGTGKSVERLARVFDIASRNGVFITANGATDDHDGDDWLGPGRRWLTSVWSPTRRESDLCRAMKSGRAWFYDPKYWKGTLDLRLDGASRMGGVSFSSKKRADLVVSATDLPAGSTLDVVVGRCDLAGAKHLKPVNHVYTIHARNVHHGRWSRTLDRGVGIYVRAAVRASSGDIIGFSNPLWVLPMRLHGQVAVPAVRR